LFFDGRFDVVEFLCLVGATFSYCRSQDKALKAQMHERKAKGIREKYILPCPVAFIWDGTQFHFRPPLPPTVEDLEEQRSAISMAKKALEGGSEQYGDFFSHKTPSKFSSPSLAGRSTRAPSPSALSLGGGGHSTVRPRCLFFKF
jgi:hypothetical protein